ncbi:PLD nuclease N-terminal domain-containing protein [Streptomyces xiaopingdaonensis]|uniref:PLD nuclease N-terminal domain-containing protein n=1 Tax=Streptomyces xiaopingdaonensis TaxID=1565415 RepID=UPI0002F79964|nr:PLD nuclease N-terminal domain-containing protein [Streptomyces xiaopingdaonensis]
MLRYLPFLLIIAVWIYSFIDVLNTPEKEVRKLPKLAWVFIVLLFGQVLVGPIAWFVAGRPRKNAPYGAVRPQERRWVAPDDNPDFLNSLKDKPSSRDEDPAPEPPEGEAGPEERKPGQDGADPGKGEERPRDGGPAAGGVEDHLREWEEDFKRGGDDNPGR